MKEYKKPIVMVNGDVAEGVYAASGNVLPMMVAGDNGTIDCWTISTERAQDGLAGKEKIFEVSMTHHTNLQHISDATTVTFYFSSPLVNAYSEFASTYSGNQLTVVRTLLADAYMEGDEVTYKIWVQSLDDATTDGLEIIGIGLDCDKAVNVQGNGGDEI